jgi:trk system potassium uptake protein TrkH
MFGALAAGSGRLAARWRGLAPARMFALSFATLIGIGTIGFQVLPGLYAGEEMTWLEGLFTATSAVCVTGLIVQDTATFFTPFGQFYVLVLIQLGGLGVVTFATWILIALGQRIPVRQEGLSVDPGSPFSIHPRRLVRSIIRYTLAIEAVGAALLWVLLLPAYGPARGGWHAVFQAISAFCNAGFSTFSDSLLSFSGRPAVLLVIMALIVAGGIGFLTLSEVRRAVTDRRFFLGRRAELRGAHSPLTAHTRIVLASTAILLVSGGVLFTWMEWSGTLGAMSIVDRLVNGMFMSVTARTAGFNSIDYASASDSSNFLTILLMTVGGSPGSTAGGIKTTTMALLVLLAVARLRGRETVNVGNRSIPNSTVQRSVGLAVLVFAVLATSVFVMSAVEVGITARSGPSGRFLDVLFEATSALNTVGLSLGATSDLSTTGRWITILLMFAGRVGPLTFVSALSRSGSGDHKMRLAQQDVLIG